MPKDSERQVIRAALCCGLLRRGEGSCCGILLRREGSCGHILLRGERSCLGNTCRSCRYGLGGRDIVGTDVIIPSSIILTCIDVKLYVQVLSNLNVKLLDAFLTENIKDTSFRISTRNLEDIFLSHP